MKLKITLVKSPISSLQKHIDTVKALGLRKICLLYTSPSPRDS